MQLWIFRISLLRVVDIVIIKHINEPENNHGDFKFTSANILGNVVFTNVTARSLDLKFSSIIGAFNAQDINISNFD